MIFHIMVPHVKLTKWEYKFAGFIYNMNNATCMNRVTVDLVH